MEESMFCDENGKPFPRTNKFDMDLYNKKLEEQAEKYRKENYVLHSDSLKALCEQSWIDGAKQGMEHAIKWHDLRKNHADLPKLKYRDNSWSITVANQLGEACHYNYKHSRWENPLFTEIEGVIAWCELPQFKEIKE